MGRSGFKDRQTQLSLCCNGSGSNSSSSAGVGYTENAHHSMFQKSKKSIELFKQDVESLYYGTKI